MGIIEAVHKMFAVDNVEVVGVFNKKFDLLHKINFNNMENRKYALAFAEASDNFIYFETVLRRPVFSRAYELLLVPCVKNWRRKDAFKIVKDFIKESKKEEF